MKFQDNNELILFILKNHSEKVITGSTSLILQNYFFQRPIEIDKLCFSDDSKNYEVYCGIKMKSIVDSFIYFIFTELEICIDGENSDVFKTLFKEFLDTMGSFDPLKERLKLVLSENDYRFINWLMEEVEYCEE